MNDTESAWLFVCREDFTTAVWHMHGEQYRPLYEWPVFSVEDVQLMACLLMAVLMREGTFQWPAY